MAEMETFWNEKHPLSARSQELCKALVPMMGACTTVQGELLRASMKIGYDWYNNGWGCNNWSGAVCFIQQNMCFLPLTSDQRQQLITELNYVHEYSHGEPCNMNYNGRNCRAVTTIHEIIVQGILVLAANYHSNNDDMYNYSEDDYIPENEDEEEGEGW